uniref:Putative Starch synthase n=1 Tax=mine drainage metagenome TaxID=410659 RepID=E6PZJ0_9ZZZZ
MHIVFAASECVPFAKTGGLADVVGALPPELVRLGHRVTVYLPLYRTVRPFLPESYPYAIRSLTVPFPYYNRFAGVVDGGVRDGAQYYFIDCPELFDREGFYGPRGADDYGDNAERFGLFCRAVLEATKQLGVPDVFHVHDWQTALLAVLLRSVYFFDPVLRNVGVVLTVHNAGYQGWFPPRTTELLLLPWEMFTFDKLEQNDTFNFLKGGTVFSDYITTVSPTYAREIQGPEFGLGLEGIFSRRHWDMRGILNGVDYSQWNPASDGHLAAHYSAEEMAGKAECRRDLLHAFGLANVPRRRRCWGLSPALQRRRASTFWPPLPISLPSAIWCWWRSGPASRTTKTFSAALPRGIPARWRSRCAMMTRWRTRSRRARTSSSCRRATNPAG